MTSDKKTKIRQLRKMTGLSQTAFGKAYNIPLRTIQGWEGGEREAPDYVVKMLERLVEIDFKK